MSKERAPNGQFKPGAVANPAGRRGKSPRMDGWASALTAIGSAQDKRGSHNFEPVLLPYEKCIDIFEGDDLGRRAASKPIEDAFRQGYEISIADEGDYEDLKRDVKKQLRKLKVDQVIKKAITQKRALGGSAILIGVRDNKAMDRPLNLEKASNIEFLTNLEPMDLAPYSYYEDPTEPKFGEVKLWELRAWARTGAAGLGGEGIKTAATEKHTKGVLIHESRLIIFNQDPISRYSQLTNPAGEYWGLSIYTQIYEILRDFNISWSAAGLLVVDFSQAVFSIENLMQLVARDPDALRDRMRAMEMGRSVARAILIDTKESFERKTTNVSGLPDLLVQLSRRFAAAIDIPLTVLMSGGAKSDQAEMGDELRYYYDYLTSVQRDDIGPIILTFVEIIMRGLRQRKIPKQVDIKWHPLWQLTDEQKANARLAQARVDAIYIKHGVLDPQVVATIRFGGEYTFDTALPGSYKAPGFMALPPVGVLVDGMDPKTGLPPGVMPPEPGKPGGGTNAGGAGAHGVGGYTRRNPRQTSMAGSDQTAGGDTEGGLGIDHADIDPVEEVDEPIPDVEPGDPVTEP